MNWNKKIFIIFMSFLSGVLVFGQDAEEKGKNLYELKCGRCHFVYQPQKYSMEEWKTVLKDMGSLSGLDEQEEQDITAYLAQMSSKKVKSLPTNPVLSGYLYTEYFSSPASTDTFDIHYLNFNVTGRLHDRVSYKAEFELEHGGGEAEPPFVEQAYLDFWPAKNIGLKIGAFLTPFNRFDEFHGPLENLMITRPQMSREIGVSAWKEVGVNLHGHIALHRGIYLSYDAYLINGLGAGSRLRNSRQYRDNNDAKSLGFRLGGVFMDRIEVGTSFYSGAWDDEGEKNLNLLGFHLLGRLGELNLHAEYARSLSENPDPFEQGKGSGYFVQASYLISQKFRPTFRFGTLDYLDRSNLLGRQSTDRDIKIAAFGFNYYLSSAIVFKVEYDIVMEGERIEKQDNNVLAFQAAIRF